MPLIELTSYMPKSLRSGTILSTAILLFSIALPAFAQTSAPAQASSQPRAAASRPAMLQAQGRSFDAAFMFVGERMNAQQLGVPAFWFKGGAADVSYNFANHLGLAADIAEEHASNVAGSQGITKLSYMFGPRYSLSPIPNGAHTVKVYGEWLFGMAHVSGAPFRGNGNLTSTSSGFSMKLGAGVDWPLTAHIGIRPVEVAWIHSDIANQPGNVQQDFRAGAGITLHM